ncbi:MAG: hypothetical protein HC941_04420 [Microcoleus sp. SU_5_3]|nr:hypothetical protein [Microcoleus sp. SU_5_3]
MPYPNSSTLDHRIGQQIQKSRQADDGVLNPVFRSSHTHSRFEVSCLRCWGVGTSRH